MDPVHTSPTFSELNSLPFPRKPHQITSHEDVNAFQQFQLRPMPSQNDTAQHSFGGDAAFQRPAKRADESSPTAVTKLDEGGRKITYAKLIHIALLSSETKQMELRELYDWFQRNTRRASKGEKGWKNSVRSNLCLNKAFQRVNDKGSYWKLAHAGLTELQPTHKHRANRIRKAKVSTAKENNAASSPTPCASNSRDALDENMSETGQGHGNPWTPDGSTSPEGSQPEGGPSAADYPTSMPIVSARDGLEYVHDPLWAWNLDSRRYINWPYCSCFCSRCQLSLVSYR